MSLPADSHVHSEWSWDTGGPRSHAAGRMRATCARAVRIGLPAMLEFFGFGPGSTPEDLWVKARPL